MKQNRYVVAATIEISKQNVDRLFLIPTERFGLGKFFVLNEQHPNFHRYLIESESIKEKILDVYKGLET